MEKQYEIITEKATDMEQALYYSHHIDNPCETKVNGETKNIRDFWIRKAKEALERMEEPFAKKILADKIAEYEK